MTTLSQRPSSIREAPGSASEDRTGYREIPVIKASTGLVAGTVVMWIQWNFWCRTMCTKMRLFSHISHVDPAKIFAPAQCTKIKIGGIVNDDLKDFCESILLDDLSIQDVRRKALQYLTDIAKEEVTQGIDKIIKISNEHSLVLRPEQYREISKLVKDNKKIQAIKLLRDYHDDLSLKDAKDAIESGQFLN